MATQLLSPILSQAGQIASISSPIPYLGPAFQLASALIDLCQNVTKNRHAARELAYRCQQLVNTIEEDTVDRDPGSVQQMVDDLIDLLTNVKTKMTEWGSIEWIKGFVKQAKISEEIKKYNEEIDRYCQRFMVKSFRVNFEWQKKFEEQTKADHKELLKYLADESHAREFALNTQRELIADIREDVKELADLLQQNLLNSHANSKERVGLEANFSALICSSEELPPVCELTPGLVRKTSSFPLYGQSGIFDIYRGVCYNKIEAAIKVWRHVTIDHNTKRRFDRQHKYWKAVYEKDHGEHILPLLGVVYQTRPEPLIMLCSKWMENGNATNYVKRVDHVDRRYLVRKIAEGLSVLHTFEPPLMHGYIRGSNIIINEFGDPLLADFGLMRVVEESPTIDMTSLPQSSEAVRWLPIEMIYDDEPSFPTSLKADITMWAFTALELMTGEKPFNHLRHSVSVILQRRDGLKPVRPGPEVSARGLDDKLWALMERCWVDEPEARPTIQEILDEL